MSTPVNIYSSLKNTGNDERDNSGEEMRVAGPFGPRIRSKPQDIIRPDMSHWRASSVDDEPPTNQYGFPMRWTDKIAMRLRRPMELHAALFDGDDGYNSGGEGNEINDRQFRQQGGNHQFDHIFLMDEDYDFEDESRRRRMLSPPRRQQEDPTDEIYFPEHFFTMPVVVNRPLKRSVPYSVEEYQELTSNGRCRRSGNRSVDPRELRSLYQRVRDYMTARREADRKAAEMKLPTEPVEVPRSPSLDVVEEEEGEIMQENDEENDENDDCTYEEKYFRKRMAEKLRRSRLGILHNNLFEVDPIKEVAASFDPRPSSPIDKTPEPLNQFLFDEQELN